MISCNILQVWLQNVYSPKSGSFNPLNVNLYYYDPHKSTTGCKKTTVESLGGKMLKSAQKLCPVAQMNKCSAGAEMGDRLAKIDIG